MLSQQQSDTLSDIQRYQAITSLDELRTFIPELIETKIAQFDPVRFCFIETMSHKALNFSGAVQSLIEKKTIRALSTYLDDYCHTIKSPAALNSEKQQTNEHLQRLTLDLIQGHQRKNDKLKKGFEDELKQLENDIFTAVMGSAGEHKTPDQCDSDANELSAMRDFRELQKKHMAEKRIVNAIENGPKEAGPLNSQALMIRSLSTMRTLSSSYVNRFTAYLDTLLWLEKAVNGNKSSSSKKTSKRQS
jgi:hypothetical protein